MTDPGRLNQRLILEVPIETADGAGGVVRSHEAGPALWASLKPVSARADIVAAANGATITHRVVIRGTAGITTLHRLRKGARIFRIVAVREEDASARFLTIDAEERRD
jgi:SPP1 family predicted phage head-tail adaptor